MAKFNQKGQSLIEALALIPIVCALLFGLFAAFDGFATAMTLDHSLEELLLCKTHRSSRDCLTHAEARWPAGRLRPKFRFENDIPLRASATLKGRVGWQIERRRELPWPPTAVGSP